VSLAPDRFLRSRAERNSGPLRGAAGGRGEASGHGEFPWRQQTYRGITHLAKRNDARSRSRNGSQSASGPSPA
jgi:hypothetical protein